MAVRHFWADNDDQIEETLDLWLADPPRQEDDVVIGESLEID